MDRDEIWQVIDDQRLGLADLFDDLSAKEWQAASLCRRWRVRDVAAHLTRLTDATSRISARAADSSERSRSTADTA